MKNKLLHLAILSSSALAAGLASPGYAQSAPAEAGATVETAGSANDIVVTARRIEERLQNVPISITVFNQQQLANSNINNATDMATYTPSLNANSRFGQNQASFAIRGFTQEIRTAPSVGVYFAEAVQPRAGLVGSYAGEGAGPGLFFDLQNIQVLKGPQGTLFGRNTTGGAVLLVPQRPTDKLEGYVEGTYGNLNDRRLQAVINVPVNDKIRVRLGADWEKRDGYEKNISGIGPDRLGKIDRYAVRGSSVVDLTDTLENYFIGYYQHNGGNNVIPVVTQGNCGKSGPGQDGPFACAQIARDAGKGFWTVENSAAVANTFTKSTTWQLINKTKWEISDDLTVRNIATYGEYKFQTATDVFGDNFPVFFSLTYPASTPTGPGGLGYGGKLLPQAHEWSASEEFQLLGNFGKLEWQAGVYYERNGNKGLSGQNSASNASCKSGSPPDIEAGKCTTPNGPGIIFGPGFNKNRFRDVGIYAQGTYSFSDKLKATGGIRYTSDSVHGWNEAVKQTTVGGPFFCQYGPIIGPSSPPAVAGTIATALPISNISQCLITPKTKSSAPTWVIDLDYFPVRNVMLYAKYSRGYRQGTVNIFSLPVPPFNKVDPEKVDVYEVGTKTSWQGETPGSLNVAFFYNDFKNQQVLASIDDVPLNRTPGTASIVNIPKSRIQGFEADGSLRLFKMLNLTSSAAFLDTKVIKTSIPSLGPTVPISHIIPTVAVGGMIPNTPKWKVTAGATVIVPVPDEWGQLTFGAVYSFTGRQLNQAGPVTNGSGTLIPNVYLHNYALWNLNANWKNVGGLPIDLSAFAVNVANNKYFLSFNNRNSAGYASQLPAEPRTFGLRVKYRFGA